MYTFSRRSDHVEPGSRTAIFQGEAYGSEVSFFWVDSSPGEGPPLHRHPYTETWTVLGGQALATIDGTDRLLEVGDIAVIGARTAHRFRAAGEDRLHMMCIHASPTIIEEQLEDEGAGSAP